MAAMWLTACRDDMSEADDLIARFGDELWKPIGDGAKKRSRNEKPPWWQDDSHMAAVFSHLMKRERGELVDPDSGAHPYVHAACRLLMIALIETGNVPTQSAMIE